MEQQPTWDETARLVIKRLRGYREDMPERLLDVLVAELGQDHPKVVRLRELLQRDKP